MVSQAPLGHSWDVTPEEAFALQWQLRERVLICPLDVNRLTSITAVRAVCRPPKVIAAAVTFRLDQWQVLDTSFAECPFTFPYTPGLFAFSAAPAMLTAIAQLNSPGDVIMVEGHGVAHPRRFGIACHIGVALDHPVMGCARSLLIGTVKALPDDAGSVAAVLDGDETIGFAFRSRKGVKPIYVSVGHRMDESSLLALIRICNKGYRLPEPLRLGRELTNKFFRM